MKEVRKEVLEARERIREWIRETPLEFSRPLSRPGSDVYLKLENFQVTGSFKIRGVINKILSLGDSKHLITASTGNHGVAFAHAVTSLGLRGIVFLPENASPTKIRDIELYDIELKFYGRDSAETELYAREYARKHGWTYISPYNDAKVIGGQGTVGIELERLRPDRILVPVGGGGLISGIAGYLKESGHKVEVIGVQPENSAVMYYSLRAGSIVNLESRPTLSDGTAGGVEPGSMTFGLCRRYVDRFVLVSEEEIRDAIIFLLERHHILVEGAGALSVAAYLKEGSEFDGVTTLIITGSRIDLDTLRGVLEERSR